MMSNLRRRLISWHAGCIDYWYQPNKYYERPIRIHLRSLSTLRRKRPWRPRDFSLCAPYSRCRLLDLAICADSCENLCAWTRGARSLPYDYDTAFFAGISLLRLLRVLDLLTPTSSTRLIPSGVSSKAHARINATGNPIMSRITTSRTAQFGISKSRFSSAKKFFAFTPRALVKRSPQQILP
jgi:hypothetical protein